MLPAQRRAEMLHHIRREGGVDTESLAKRFGVSPMTARRDLKALEQENRLKLTWGGAIPLTFLSHEIPYNNKVSKMPEAKELIADNAASLVTDGSCILLDAGTSTFALAKKILHRKLTVVTSDLQIAMLLLQSPSISVHVTGGAVDHDSRSCNDTAVAAFLDSINVTLAFIGTNVWDVSRGASTSSRMRMHIKRKMMERAEKTILLADSSKYGAFGPHSVAQLQDFTCIITDPGLSKANRESVLQSEANLRIAG